MEARVPRLTRRQLLAGIGRAGGAAALFNALAGLGFLAPVAAYEGPPRLSGEIGKGKRVVILGGGLAGLACAYELSRANYDCTLLEARERVGGRNLTARRGTVLKEYDSEQVCDFDADPNLYFNCGPARIPGHHEAVLDYCRRFGVPLEVLSNDNRSALMHDSRAFGGKPVRQSRVINDSRGYIAELLAKALDSQALDAEVSDLDKERLRAFLKQFGDLDSQWNYTGTERVPFTGGGFLEPGIKTEPLDLAELLRSDFWQFKMHFGEMADQAATMLQPVGGMDRIVHAFEQRVEHLIVRNAPVLRILNKERGVEVVYRDPDGAERLIEADYAINNIPMHILVGIENNFSDAFKAAIAAVPAGKLFKIGLQARRRFWEEDDHIYGGISWTSQDITQIWYPSQGIHDAKGVLLGAYTFLPEQGEKFGRMTPEERIAAATRQGERLHPGYAGEIETGVSIAWHKVPYLFGCAARWTPQTLERYFATVSRPQGRIFLVGDQVTHHSGWQEGAIRSAHSALHALQERIAGHA